MLARSTIILLLGFLVIVNSRAQKIIPGADTIPYPVYPELIDHMPDLFSPFIYYKDEFVIAVTREEKYAIIPVTLSNDRDICLQLIVDTADFPGLATSGLHNEMHLDQIKTITGRTIQKITELGLPNRLSQAGFLAEDEDIMNVLKADNRIVRQMGLTHPELAKPLFHVLNMMDTDLSLDSWNMAKHQWENIQYFFYNNKRVYVEAFDTKGGQQSIFNENLDGSFHISLWRKFDQEESRYLHEHYGHLSPEELNGLKNLLTFINTGELEPQYIMRYGFYEGHTFWRADPIAIAFIFGLRSLRELDNIFDGKLLEMLNAHHTD
jgi:hypothetical protein